MTPVLEEEADNVLVYRPLCGEDLSCPGELTVITFILPWKNLAWMKVLSVIASENKNAVFFQRDQDLVDVSNNSGVV